MQKITKKRYGLLDTGAVFSTAVASLLVIPNIISIIVVLIASSVNGKQTEFSELLKNPVLMFFMLALNQAIVFSVCFFYSKLKGISLFKANSINETPRPANVALASVSGFTVTWLLYPLTALFMLILSKMGYSQSALNFPSIDNAGGLIASIFIICLLPAFCEELLFRGIILNGLRSKGNVFAILISSLFFCIFHQNPQQTVHQFLLGVVLASLAIKTGNIYVPMIIHFFNNFTVVLFTYFSEVGILQLGVGGTTMSNGDWIMFGIACGLAVIVSVGFLLLNKKPIQHKHSIEDEIEILEGAYPDREVAIKKQANKYFWLYSALGLAICATMWIISLVQGFGV